MKNLIAFCVMASLVLACSTKKETAEHTIFGMGSDYFNMPETLKGKVKVLRETNYWAVEKDGKFTKGNIMTWKELDSVQSTKHILAYFDEDGLIKEYNHFDENNNIMDGWKGQQVNGLYTRYESRMKDSITSYTLAVYDDKARLTKAESFNMKDSLRQKQVYLYDEKGNYIKHEILDPHGEKRYYQYLTWNDNGKVVDYKVLSKTDSLMFSNKNTYNDAGLITRQDYNVNGKPVFWEYEYLKFDDHGNWVQLVANIDGKYRLFSERYYEYY